MVSQARVLHVEDEASFAEMAASFLERVDDGLTVDTESDASGGLDALGENTYDCIISDYDMPGMDGIEFLEHVRERNADIPFILYTGKGSEEIASEAISAGVTDYVQKGSSRDHFRVLANRIRNAVDTYASTRAATRERDRLEQTLSSIPSGALLVDEEGTVEYANEAARELIGDGISIDQLTDFRDKIAADGGITEIDALGGSKTVVVGTMEVGDVHDVAGADSDVSEQVAFAQPGNGNGSTVMAALFDSVADPVYVLDEEGHCLYANSALEGLTGYSLEQLVDEHASAVLTDEGIERGRRNIDRLLAEGGPDDIKYELEIRCADGTTVPCEDHISEVRFDNGTSGVIGVLRDITDRKHLEREATDNEAALRELHEAAAGCYDSFEDNLEALIEVGRNRLDLPIGYITHIDHEEQRIVACSGDAAFEPGDTCPTDRAYCRKTIETEDPIAISRASEEGWADDPAYEEFGFEVYVGGRLVIEDDVYGTLCFGSQTKSDREFTRLQRAFLDVLRRMVEDVIQQHHNTKALERQNERLDEFASAVSHDLRNPLQTAMGNLQMLSEDVDHPAVGHVGDQLDRIDELIENLLDYAYNGTNVEDFDTVDLAREANVAWDTVDAPTASLAIEEGLPGVLADTSRLRQLLENLFANATTHAGADVTVRVGTIDRGFYIADDGPGLPDDDVFAPGYTTRHDGTGFGLAIVREIAEAHGWEISATDDPDLGGARFEFTGVDFAAEVSQ